MNSQGISDTPAWIVASANTYAKLTGKTPFVIYQGKWNVLYRDFEREILPMARKHGLALAPFAVLGSGKIRTDEEEERRRATGENGESQALMDHLSRKLLKLFDCLNRTCNYWKLGT